MRPLPVRLPKTWRRCARGWHEPSVQRKGDQRGKSSGDCRQSHCGVSACPLQSIDRAPTSVLPFSSYWQGATIKARARQLRQLFGQVAIAIAALPCTACGERPEASGATASAKGLAALAEAQPRGATAVGWRVLDGLGVPAWLFYPAVLTEPATSLPVIQKTLPDGYSLALRRRFGAVAAATLVAAPGHALPDAAMADGVHPLLVFAPGAGMGGRDYRLFVEALAAQGYAVALLRPTGSPAASDVRYSESADEIGNALENLRKMAGLQEGKGRIEATTPVLIGHSLGGTASVLAATRTGVCAINIDGDFGGASVTSRPSGPVLYVIGDPSLDRASDVARRAEVWRTVSGRSGGRALALGIAGMRHFDIADAANLPLDLIPPDRREGRFGNIGGANARRVMVDLVVQFAGYCQSSGGLPLSAALRLPPEARSTFGH